jgi:hypothetical protein
VLLQADDAGAGDDVAFGILDWVDWTGIGTLLLVVLLALLWVWWYGKRD